MSESENDAIRAFVVDKVTLLADNTQHLHMMMSRAAVEGVELETSRTWDRRTYSDALAGRDDDGLAALHGAVGAEVADALSTFIDECREVSEDYPATMLGLLSDLLDLGDRRQWVLFGRHYLPEVDDVFPEGDDDE